MRRRERRIPLLFVAAFCIGAAVPAAARASIRFAAPRGATLEATWAGAAVFAAGGIEKECVRAEFKGTLLQRSRALELAPLYGECTAKSLGGLPTKMVWWDCGYVLHPVARMHSGAWRAKVDLACPDAHKIEWNVYESTAKYDLAATLCVTTMPPQRSGGFAELSNAKGSPEQIAVRWALRGIEYEAFGSSLFCGVPEGIAKSDSTYTGRAVIGASDLAGRRVDFGLSG